MCRLGVDWTQTDLGNATGLAQSQISLYENGELELGDALLTKIRRALERKANTRGKAGKAASIRQLTEPLLGSPAAAEPMEEPTAAEELKMRRIRRQRAGLSRPELARRIPVKTDKLRDWERGHTRLSEEEFKRWGFEVTRLDPYFKFEVANDYGKELLEQNRKLEEEVAELRAKYAKLEAAFMNSEQISTLRYAQIEELAQRIERLQSPLIKGSKE
jgi:transcriptional regulator with XRE-family HTH domain